MNTDKAAATAGEVKGQAEEKGSTIATQAGDLFNSAKDSAQQAGEKIVASAQGATEAVKNATGFNNTK